jgi:hypothetical protein
LGNLPQDGHDLLLYRAGEYRDSSGFDCISSSPGSIGFRRRQLNN